MEKNIGKILSFIILASLLLGCFSDYCIVNAEEKNSSNFQFVDSSYGIKKDDIYAKELEILSDNVKVLDVRLSNLIALKEEVNSSTVKIYLLGSKGVLKTFELSATNQWVKDITDIAMGNNSSTNNIFSKIYRNSYESSKEHENCIYKVKNPDGKYDLINIDTGKYFDYGFDTILVENRSDVDGVIKYTQNGLVGLLDCHGEKLTEAIYTNYYKIKDDYYLVTANSSEYGLLSTDGVYDGALEYSRITYETNNHRVSNLLVAEKKDGSIIVIYPELGKEVDISYVEHYELGLNDVLLEEYIDYYSYVFWEQWSILDENGEKTSIESLFGGEYNSASFKENDVDIAFVTYDKVWDESRHLWSHDTVLCGVMDSDYEILFDGTQYEWIKGDEVATGGWSAFCTETLDYFSYTLDNKTYTYEIMNREGEVLYTFSKSYESQSDKRYCNNIFFVKDYAIIQFEENVYRSIDLETKEERVILDVKNVFALDENGIGDNQYIKVIYTDKTYAIINLKNGKSYSDDTYDSFSQIIPDGDSGVLLMKGDDSYAIVSPDFKMIMKDVLYDGGKNVLLKYVWKDQYRYTLSGELISDEQWKRREVNFNDEQLHRICHSETLYRDWEYIYINTNGNTVLDDNYYYLSEVYNGLGYYAKICQRYDEESDEFGIIDVSGEKLISGRFNNRFVNRYSSIDISPWGGGIILQRQNGNYIFYNWTNYLESDEDLQIVSLSPEVGAADVSLSLNNIEIEFNKAVNIFEGRGNIAIKDYDTDETILTYRMLSGSQVGQVVYKSSRNKKKIVLTNAMTALEEGRTYYITIEGDCFSDFGNMDGVSKSKWLPAIEDKDILYFSTSSGNVNFSYMTCAAACELGQYSGIESGLTVGELLASDAFEDKKIWNKGTNSYKELFQKELRNYNIVAYVKSTIEKPGYMVLKNDEKKVIIYVCIDSVAVLGKSMNDDSINESFDMALGDYLNYLDAYAGYDVRVTGNYYGAIMASYISTITDTQAILFNNLDCIGTDTAYRNGYLSVRDYHGIDNQNNINFYNQYLQLFVSKQYDVYKTARLKSNNYGDSIVSLNSLYCYKDGSFVLNDVIEEEMPLKVVRKSVRTNQETLNAVKDFYEKNFLTGAKNFILKTGVELVLGASTADSEPFSDILTSSREQVIYTGGASTGTDIYSGGFVNNVFYHSNGNAILNGSNYQDIYVIKRTNGTVTINDTSSAAGTIKQKKELVECITSVDGYNSLLLGFENVSELIKSIENGVDHIYLLDTPVDEDSFVYNGSYYEMQTASGKVRISPEWTTKVVVTGTNGTETTIPSMAESLVTRNYSLKALADSVLQTSSEGNNIQISAMRINGDDINISLYDAQNNLIETLDENCSDEYCAVRQYDNMSYLFLSEKVYFVEVSGANLKDISFINEDQEIRTIDGLEQTNEVQIYLTNGSVKDLNDDKIMNTVILEKTLSEELIGIVAIPVGTSEYYEWETVSCSDYNVYAYYGDGSVIQILSEECSLNGTESDDYGDHIATIEYDGKKTEIQYTIVEDEDFYADFAVDYIMMKINESKNIEINADVYNYDEYISIESEDEDIVAIRGTYAVAMSEGIAKLILYSKSGEVLDTMYVYVNEGGLIQRAELNETSIKMDLGEEMQLDVINVYPQTVKYYPIVWSVSDEDIVTVTREGILQAIEEGETTLVCDIGGLKKKIEVIVKESEEKKPSDVKDPTTQSTEKSNEHPNEHPVVLSDTTQCLPTVGTEVKLSNVTYKVTKSSAESKEVAFVEQKSNKKGNVTIPATVTIDGKIYKVTEIAPKAFKNNKKLKSVTIGKYVTKIGKEAFSGCKNLKTITIKSTSLKSVEKNAIKGINENATIKVPKKQLSKYKKLFKSSTGYKKSMKIKRS